MKDYISAFVCEGSCGSPCYTVLQSKWIFETNKIESRMVCGGCGHVQSREYSDDLMNDKIKPPIFIGDDWVYPDDEHYQEVIHFSEHEPLIEIVGLSRKEITQHPARRYS